MAKLTERTRSGFRFDPAADKLDPVDLALADELEDIFRPHLDDSILDVARRVGAGTGSLGVDRFFFSSVPTRRRRRKVSGKPTWWRSSSNAPLP